MAMKDERGTEPTTVAISADQLATVLETVGQKNAEAMRASLRKDNPNYNEKGVFTNPEGERVKPKEKLVRECYFCGIRLREDQLTPTEVGLLNRFNSTKEAHDGRWTAKLARNGARELLLIDVPAKTIDERMSLPNGMALILLELLDGADAVNPESLLQTVKELKSRVVELEKGWPVPVRA